MKCLNMKHLKLLKVFLFLFFVTDLKNAFGASLFDPNSDYQKTLNKINKAESIDELLKGIQSIDLKSSVDSVFNSKKIINSETNPKNETVADPNEKPQKYAKMLEFQNNFLNKTFFQTFKVEVGKMPDLKKISEEAAKKFMFDNFGYNESAILPKTEWDFNETGSLNSDSHIGFNYNSNNYIKYKYKNNYNYGSGGSNNEKNGWWQSAWQSVKGGVSKLFGGGGSSSSGSSKSSSKSSYKSSYSSYSSKSRGKSGGKKG